MNTLLPVFLFTLLIQIQLIVPLSFSLSETFQFQGTGPGKFTGVKVASAGDFNNDGYSDFLVSSIVGTGETYLIYGTSTIQHPFNLSTLNGTNGVQFNGINTGDQSGYSVSSAGDVNNDGFSDFIIGAPQASPNSITQSGSTYLIYGTSALLPHPFNLSSLNGTNGVQINGIEVGDFSSSSISFAGDFNKDGFSDFLIGAYQADPNGNPTAGETYLIFGTSTFPHPFNLSSLNGTNGIQFNGIDMTHYSGFSLSSAGDFNNDGFDDILIGAYGSNSNSGSTYLIYGTTNIQHPFNLSTLNGTNGVQFNGINTGDQSGYSVSSAGDVNNDGFSDFIIGAPQASPNSITQSGSTYLIYGTSALLPHPFNLSSLNGTNGVQINGITSGDKSGHSLSSADDIDNNSYSDFLIGSKYANSNAGETYLIYGTSALLPHPFNLSSLNGSNGIQINGINSIDYSGATLAAVGDFNNDGFSDFIIGAKNADPNSIFNAGSSYLILGRPTFGYSFNLTTGLFLPCLPGSSGSYPLLGELPCTLCSLGHFSRLFASTKCFECPVGTYASITGAIKCSLCPAGTYQSHLGQQSSSNCLSCPPGFFSPSPGSSSCAKCPIHASCAKSSTITPLPDPGYQLIPNSHFKYGLCIPPEACPGKSLKKCTLGYQNPSLLCSECASNYYRNKGKCEPCPTNYSAHLPIVLILYTIGLILLIPLSARGHKFGLSSMFAAMFQTISLFSYININIDSKAMFLWNSTFNLLSTTLFSLEIAAPECSTSNYFTSWYIQILSPFISLGIYLVLFAITLGLRHLITLKSQWIVSYPLCRLASLTSPFQILTYFLSSVIFMINLLYIIVTKSALSILTCTKVSESLYLMNASPSTHCYSNEWYIPAILSVIVLIFFTLGIPGFILFYISPKAKNHALDSDFLLIYGAILDKYNPEYSYWEAIALIRKSLLLAAALSFHSDFNITSTIFILIFVISTAIHTKINPFWTKWLNHFETLIFSSSLIILTILFFIVFYHENDESIIFFSILNIVSICISFFIACYFASKHKLEYVLYMKERQLDTNPESLELESRQ